MVLMMIGLGIFTSLGFAQDGFDEQRSLDTFIKDRKYTDALTYLEAKSTKELTAPELKLLPVLKVIVAAETAKPQNSSVAVLDQVADPVLTNKVNQLYWAAQAMILDGQSDQAKDLLLYSLYLSPGYYKAQYLLENGYSLGRSDYKPYDVASKLKSRSKTYFYGGNYLMSIKDLEVLIKIDKDDASLYEQLGSNYYMIDEKKKAVDYWSASLLLNPANKPLKDLIQKTKDDLIEEQKKMAQSQSAQKVQVRIDDPQVMGVFKSQSDALELMQQLKARGLTVITEQNEKGQLKVIVSRKQLMSQPKQN